MIPGADRAAEILAEAGVPAPADPLPVDLQLDNRTGDAMHALRTTRPLVQLPALQAPTR
jgi:hypothetical protein